MITPMQMALRALLIFVLSISAPDAARSQTIYQWVGVNGSWTSSFNWQPSRDIPHSSDVLHFNSGTTLTVLEVPNETIASIFVSDNTNVTLLTAGGSKTLTLTGILNVENGSALVIGSVLQGSTFSNSKSEPIHDAPTFSITDNENNFIEFKFGKSRSTLFNSPRIVALGSSTLFGSGATPGFKLHERLKSWVEGNTVEGEFYHIATNGYYSNMFLPDGESAESKWNKNIQAALTMDPDIVLISLPTNDIAFLSIEQFIGNLQRMGELCRERNIHFFVIGTQPRNDFFADRQQLLFDANIAILEAFGTRAINVFPTLAEPYTPLAPARIKGIYNADNIHPNNAGQGVIADSVIAVWQRYFVDNDHLNYTIERSVRMDSGFDVYADNIDPTLTRLIIPREDGSLYYYRIRAKKADGSFTPYSNVVSLRQSLIAESVRERVQVNFSVRALQQNIPEWNEFIPMNDVPDVGEEKLNLLNTDGKVTSLGIHVIGKFPAVGMGGGRPISFPSGVIGSFWAWGADADDRPSLRITGLDPSILYNVRCLFSRAATAPYRFVGVDCQGKGSAVPSNDPVLASNDGATADLIGLQPDTSGTLELRFRALPNAGFGYLNAIIIERLSTIDDDGKVLNITLTQGASADIGGRVTIQSGILDLGDNLIVLHSHPTPLDGPGKFSLGSAATLQFGKAIDIEGPMIVLPENIFLNSLVMRDLIVNSPKGVQLSNQSIKVNNSISFISGNLYTNSVGRIIQSNTAFAFNETIHSKIFGYVEREAVLVGMGGIDFMGYKIFPGPDDLGNVTIVRRSGASGINLFNGYSSIAVTWDVSTQFKPTSGRSIMLSWPPDFDNASDVLGNFRVYRYDTGPGWTAIGNLHLLEQSTPFRRTAPVTTTHFSSWTAADEFNVLPVTWGLIEAHVDEGSILLTWEALSERNTAYYDVEKMNLEKEFIVYTRVPSSGNSISKLQYQYRDNTPSPGLNYYRIKQVDKDGRYTTSRVVSEIFKQETNEYFLVFPNPSSGSFTVKRVNSASGRSRIKIIDLLGNELYEKEWLYDDELSLELRDVSKGIYQVMLWDENGYQMSKKIVLH